MFPNEAPVHGSIGVAARTDHATKVYGARDSRVVALDDVTVEFPAGQMTAVMGSSGSGKSTLLHCAAGLDQLSSGRAFIGEADLGSLSDRELTALRRDRIGFVFQAFNLVPMLSARENMTLPLDLAGRTVDREWLGTVIGVLGIGDRLAHRPSELSGGQQQRIAIVRALATQPQIIFADEPTGNLDSRTGAEILRFLRQAVSDLGQTIVMVTHDPIAAAYADTVLFLADGHVVDRITAPSVPSILTHLQALEA